MIPGFTSTGSKNPSILFGDNTDVPRRMIRSSGCRVWDEDGRSYIDMIMALGAVALGYGHERVTEAVERAARDGGVGSLAPALEGRVAARLVQMLPGVDAVRFLKTGAEAVMAAIRIARVATGRERIVTCGYHGWLDTFSDAPGVPAAVRALRTAVPFNDVAALHEAVATGGPVAALVVEPVVDGPPSPPWVEAITSIARSVGAVLIVDEIKAGLRLGVDGVRTRYGLSGDVTVLGKALGNGYPIAAVCGRSDVMDGFDRTWVSSTLATEFVSLSACDAVLDVFERSEAAATLSSRGRRLFDGLQVIVDSVPVAVARLGIPEFCYVAWRDDEVGQRVASACARRGVLFKRDAYNFVSLAHTEDLLDEVLSVVRTAAEDEAERC